MAHKAESSKTLFDMYRRIHREMPLFLQPRTQYSSAKELSFDLLDSGIKVETASGHGVARGETINFAHLSEVGFWDPNFAANNFNALMQSIPNSDGTAIYIESTANGMNGLFYDLWKGAVEGRNGFIPFFSPWFDSPEYRAPVKDNFERTLEEEDLVERFGLDNAQLQWRRTKIATSGLELFEQEYPATPEDAFKASGRPVFDPVDVMRAKEASAKNILLNRMEVDHLGVREHSRGELHVYREHDPKENYTIGADVAMGISGGDYSVAQILDSKRRQVGMWRGHIHPDAFATVLQQLGFYYNTALVAPESNNHGLLTCVELQKLEYPNIFRHVVEGQVTEKDTRNLGFRTTHVTKPVIIDRLRAELRIGSIEINDEQTFAEMQTYVVTDSGGYKAQPKCHDDCVMSLAIANHVLVAGAWTPVEFDDDCYYGAVGAD